ncbi:MAG: sugar nucleotide-binding protein [Bacteroidota bacterium]
MVLITGANGFLGYYLTGELLKKEYKVIATGKGGCRLPYINNSLFTYTEMDFTDPFAVHDVFEKYKPSIVVHAGAMSKPDECELNQWECYIVNVEGNACTFLPMRKNKKVFLFSCQRILFLMVKKECIKKMMNPVL